ncbi:Homoserine kinase [compost metagenome]
MLPEQVSLTDAVYNISRSSLLTAAFSSGRLDLISAAMKDRIHQPYRASLIPGMSRILNEASEHGALGAALSGAGPTLLALVDKRAGTGQGLEEFLLGMLSEQGITAKTLWLEPSREGVTRLDEGTDYRSFLDIIKGD